MIIIEWWIYWVGVILVKNVCYIFWKFVFNDEFRGIVFCYNWCEIVLEKGVFGKGLGYNCYLF